MKAALDYGRLGWSTIPLQPRGKRSLIRWQVHQYRRADMTEIGDWFVRWPDANIAVVTGIVSGLVALDLDPRQGADESLERLQRHHGQLPGTVEAVTGGGGRHLYFAHPGDIVRNRFGVAPGIDLYGDGGYLVAPPSVHACGEPYGWARSPEVLRPAPIPTWLLYTPSADEAGGEQASRAWQRRLREGVAQGECADRITSLAEHLLWCGVESDLAVELLLSWNAACCRPPLETSDVLGIVESAARPREPAEDR